MGLLGGDESRGVGLGHGLVGGSLSSLEGGEMEDGRSEVSFLGDATKLFAVVGVAAKIST